jgi:hypothetical protein
MRNGLIGLSIGIMLSVSGCASQMTARREACGEKWEVLRMGMPTADFPCAFGESGPGRAWHSWTDASGVWEIWRPTTRGMCVVQIVARNGRAVSWDRDPRACA